MLQSAVRVLTWEGAEKTEGVDARGVVTEAPSIDPAACDTRSSVSDGKLAVCMPTF